MSFNAPRVCLSKSGVAGRRTSHIFESGLKALRFPKRFPIKWNREGASSFAMPPREKRRTTITYHLTSASARLAFEHGLDFHDDYEDADAAGNTSILGSSPGNSGSGLGARRQSRSTQPVFASSSGAGLPDGRGALMNGRGTERHTIEFTQLLELFPATDRHIVEEVFLGCDLMFDRALDTLSELQAPAYAVPCGTGLGTLHGGASHGYCQFSALMQGA